MLSCPVPDELAGPSEEFGSVLVRYKQELAIVVDPAHTPSRRAPSQHTVLGYQSVLEVKHEDLCDGCVPKLRWAPNEEHLKVRPVVRPVLP
jgi:hypothetical protein